MPRPVFCVIAAAHRDRALAEAVCAGRFTHLGLTLDLGIPPNWRGAVLPADEEWEIEWHKFAYGLDLAHAFCDTGDPRFLQTWERLVCSWMQQVPVERYSCDVTGRRIQHWLYAWNAFAAAPAFSGLSAGVAEALLVSLEAQIHYVRQHLTPERNHRTLELYALFIAALALPCLDPQGSLLAFASTELCRNLLTDVRPDGVHCEASTHYHCIALRSFLGVLENARCFGLTLPEGYEARLDLACAFALHCHRPDGAIPALSDSDTGSYADLLELAASLLGRPDFLYAASAGRYGVPPAQRYVSFPHGGYFIQRSGWGNGDTPFRHEHFLLFDCGPLGDGGHGHYDLLHVEIAAAGRPLIMDPGRYTYAEATPNWRRWFKSTAAHNTVCVDSMDQTPYRRGKPKGPIAQGRFVGRLSAPGFDLLTGEARSPSYEAVHTRRIAFVADEYWLLEDQLEGEYPHRYVLRFHLAPEAWGCTTLTVEKEYTVVRAPGVALLCAANCQAAVGLEPGWIAPQYGVRVPAPVVTVTADAVASATFMTLVAPLEAPDAVPTLRVQTDTMPLSQRTRVEVRGVGLDNTARDHVVWNGSDKHFALGPFQGQAAAAWWRESADGASLDFRACDVTEVAWALDGAKTWVAGAQPAPWVRWDGQRGVVTYQGEPL